MYTFIYNQIELLKLDTNINIILYNKILTIVGNYILTSSYNFNFTKYIKPLTSHNIIINTFREYDRYDINMSTLLNFNIKNNKFTNLKRTLDDYYIKKIYYYEY